MANTLVKDYLFAGNDAGDPGGGGGSGGGSSGQSSCQVAFDDVVSRLFPGYTSAPGGAGQGTGGSGGVQMTGPGGDLWAVRLAGCSNGFTEIDYDRVLAAG